jgi:hypothetical protein
MSQDHKSTINYVTAVDTTCYTYEPELYLI